MKTLLTALVTMSLLLACAPVRAADEPARTITVTGEATVEAAPDRVGVSVGYQTQEETAEAAQEVLAERMNRVLDRIEKLKLADGSLRTQRIDLSPVYSSRPRDLTQEWTPKIVGYRASSTVSIATSELGRVGEILDVTTKSGANSFNGVRFFLENNEPHRLAALEQAAASARERALSMAKGLQITVGDPISISDSIRVNQPHIPRLEQAVMSLDAPARSAPLRTEPGEVRVSATVHVTFEIE